jgi:hypothetical protein
MNYQGLTSLPEIDNTIILSLDLKSLYSLILTSKDLNSLFTDECLWKSLLERDFKQVIQYKSDDISYREMYQVISSNTSQNIKNAVKCGKLYLVAWCYHNGDPLTHELAYIAAEYGHLDIIKWINQQGIHLSITVHEIATYYGHLDILIWLLDYGIKPWFITANMAKRNGHTHILKWLESKGIYPF